MISGSWPSLRSRAALASASPRSSVKPRSITKWSSPIVPRTIRVYVAPGASTVVSRVSGRPAGPSGSSAACAVVAAASVATAVMSSNRFLRVLRVTSRLA